MFYKKETFIGLRPGAVMPTYKEPLWIASYYKNIAKSPMGNLFTTPFPMPELGIYKYDGQFYWLPKDRL